MDGNTDHRQDIHIYRHIHRGLSSNFQNVDLQCIYMPYVLNEKDRTNFLYALSDRQAAVTDLPWKMNSPAHFIDIASFNDFLRRFFTDDRPGDREMYIDPDITVSVSEDILQNTALKKYHPAASSSLAGRIRNFSEKIHAHQIGSGIASAVGVFVGSVLIEFLMRILSGYSVFQAIDFRNIYIIFAALLGGFSAGTWAAFFESLLLIIGYRQQHITFMMIVYSIDHMLPILFYFFLGTAIGYRQNRSERLIDFAQHERDAVSEQYEVLTDLYSQAVSKKTEYRNDLLNSRNGFGKIFNAVNQLQSTEPGRIMADAIPVMEDLLSNRTISIYSVFASDPDYARLQVASRDILNKVPRSIKLSDKPLFTDSLQKGEVWFNRDLAEGYPMYVSPILQGGRLIALINIREADFSETSLYYQNLLSIISKLIGNFIATAMSYQQAISDKNFVEGTGIYSREALARCLDLIVGMQKEQISTYRMFVIYTEGRRLSDMDAFLRPLVRPLDFLGCIDPEHILLIAANTDDYGAKIIMKRLSAAGLKCQPYGDVESWLPRSKKGRKPGRSRHDSTADIILSPRSSLHSLRGDFPRKAEGRPDFRRSALPAARLRRDSRLSGLRPPYPGHCRQKGGGNQPAQGLQGKLRQRLFRYGPAGYGHPPGGCPDYQ